MVQVSQTTWCAVVLLPGPHLNEHHENDASLLWDALRCGPELCVGVDAAIEMFPQHMNAWVVGAWINVAHGRNWMPGKPLEVIAHATTLEDAWDHNFVLLRGEHQKLREPDTTFRDVADTAGLWFVETPETVAVAYAVHAARDARRKGAEHTTVRVFGFDQHREVEFRHTPDGERYIHAFGASLYCMRSLIDQAASEGIAVVFYGDDEQPMQQTDWLV